MTAPTQEYGAAHRGTVRRASELDGYWFVRCTAINPLGEIGPYASTVAELAVDDRVLLTQIGTTRDDLVITGKLPAVPWDANLPIGIDDVTGLQTALDDRATDAELDALASSTDGRLDTLEATDTAYDGRLDALEAADVGLDSRLDTAEAGLITLDGRTDVIEALNTTQDGLIAGNTSAIAANATAVALLNLWALRYQDHERDIYGDLVDFGVPRWQFDNVRSASGGVGLVTRTRVRRDVTINLVRVCTTAAGVGGSGLTTAAIYTASQAVGVAYTLVASGTLALTGAVGRRNITVTPAAALTAGQYVLVLLTSNGYSTAPQHAGSSIAANQALLNPSGTIVWASKAGVTSAPATINPQDGTWTEQAAPWWVALS